MKVRELFEAKKTVSQGKVNDMIYSLALAELKKAKVDAGVIKKAEHYMLNTDTYFSYYMDEVTQDLEHNMNLDQGNFADSMNARDPSASIEDAVRDVVMNVCSDYNLKQPKWKGLPEADILAAVKKHLGISYDNLTEDWAKTMAANNRARMAALKDSEKAQREREKIELAKAKREAAKKEKAANKLTADQIYRHVCDLIGETFPDGDPSDSVAPWLRQHGLTMADVDKAFKKNGKTDMYGYIASMWDELAADALHDANNGHVDDNSPYYQTGSKGEVIRKNRNPWK